MADDSVETLAFIEVDCGTEHAPALLRKADLYQRHFQSGREQAEHDVFPLVLWLVPDAARAAQLERAFTGARRGLTRSLHQVAVTGVQVQAARGAQTPQLGPHLHASRARTTSAPPPAKTA